LILWWIWLEREEDEEGIAPLPENRRKQTELPRTFSSVIFTDGNNSVSKSVGIYQQITSVGDTVFLESCNSVMTWIFFRRFYRQNYRGIQTEIAVQ
jgi:hypothetical protein